MARGNKPVRSLEPGLRPVFPEGLRVGTCSWKYPSWKGLVYSGQPGANMLKEYSSLYDTVEIDQWFWSLFKGPKAVLPDTAVAKEYAGSVPSDFKFTVKVPNSLTLTHFYKTDVPNPFFLSTDLWERFLGRLEPILGSVALMMFQFEYLNRKKMESSVKFLELLDRFLGAAGRTVAIGLEIRNPAWLDDAFFGFLAKKRLSAVLIQGYYMPDVAGLLKKFGPVIRDTLVVRLHGGDRKSIEEMTAEKWDRIVQPRGAELSTITGLIRDLLDRRIRVYLNVNNHYEGSAPLTIRRLAETFSA